MAKAACRAWSAATLLLLVLPSAGCWLRAAQAPTARPDRHVVVADGHPLTVWGREPRTARAVVVLVHGRTWSSLPDFDLQVPGLERSVMRSLAARGVAAYAVDLRGYGATPRDASGWLTPDRAAADVVAVLAWAAARHPGRPAPALVGWSRGAAIAMLAAQRAPATVSSLVLFGFVFDPDVQFTEPTRSPVPPRIKNTQAAARSDFISPAVTAPAVIRSFVRQALDADPVTVDLRGDDQFNQLDPRKVTVPVLVIHGERDPAVTPELVQQMVAAFALPAETIVLPGGDHAAHVESTHDAWIAAVLRFVTRS